ncbi:MAG: FTR1 family iron permease, partial [Magnetococcales bacterium]|nr:FTR1 family iron permease [Magnetococcales bacterium]
MKTWLSVPLCVLWMLCCVSLGWGAELNVAKEVAEVLRQGDAEIRLYHPVTGRNSGDALASLYFDQFEGTGLETAIGMRDPERKVRLESLFSALIGLANRGAPPAELQSAWEALKALLQQTAQEYPTEGGGAVALVLQSFLILLREGFEALLVVTALAAYLRKMGAADKLVVLWQGVGWALLASVLTAWLLGWVLHLAGPAQEAMEGITMLVAAGVLFYVSYWLISKQETARWQSYIRDKIQAAVGRGELFTLGFAAFLAVYREGAETILFYRALLAQAQGQNEAVALGFGLAVVALLALMWIMRTAAMRLPMGLFFTATAVLLYFLALSFTGHGVLELQEAGWLANTRIAHLPTIPWIGFFPTRESVIAQLLLVLP